MIKRLAGCIRQYKRDTVLTPLFMLGEVSCECVIPLLTAELIHAIAMEQGDKFAIREGGHTVGDGRISTIIE